MRIRWFLLVFGFPYLTSASVPASEDAETLRLPVDEFPLIPGNAGMRFFEDTWQPLGRNSYSITKTVTVTDKAISWDDIGDVRPYSVLAERENFVLLAWYDRVGVTEHVYWTTFVILHVRYHIAAPERRPEQVDTVYNYCTDDRLKNGEKGFRLPKAALLRIFAASLCRKNILDYFKLINRSRGVIAWSRNAFARITDANRGTGWLRMRRNEKILGLPQGTVPEPK